MPIWDRIAALPADKQELVTTWLKAHDGCTVEELTAYVDSV